MILSKYTNFTRTWFAFPAFLQLFPTAKLKNHIFSYLFPSITYCFTKVHLFKFHSLRNLQRSLKVFHFYLIYTKLHKSLLLLRYLFQMFFFQDVVHFSVMLALAKHLFYTQFGTVLYI